MGIVNVDTPELLGNTGLADSPGIRSAMKTVVLAYQNGLLLERKELKQFV